MGPSHKDVRQFYNDIYYKDLRRSSNDLSGHYSRLAGKLGVADGSQVLDVACGSGEWLKTIRKLSAKVAGIDISDKAIDICKDEMPDGEFACGPAESLPFPDDTFDLVTCLGSLEHFVDQKAAIADMVRVSKPSADVLILVPNAEFLTYRLGLYKGTNQKDIKETLYSISEWREMFEESGLTVKACWRDLHTLNRSWLMRAGLPGLPARALQALLLLVWPLRWQYQVYFLCKLETRRS